MTAAAFAKEYLGFVDVEEVKRLDGLHKMLADIEGKVNVVIECNQKIKSTLETSREIYRRRRIVEWLSPPDPSFNYHRMLQQRHEETGRWFLESGAFKQWKADPKSFLWLYGIPGCGKTVLSSTIIEHLEQETTCGLLLYFYFDFNDKNKQSFDNMLRSIILQVYQSQSDSRRPLEEMCDLYSEGSRQPSTDSLQKVLQAMLNRIDNVSIVLDALDESESKPRDKLLAWLKTLVESTDTACRLLVTARREEDIESALQCWTRAEDRIPIPRHEVNRDIGVYIEHQVDNGHSLKRWHSRPDLQAEIKTKPTNKAGGMFRWVACQIETLKDCLNQQDLRSALENLPETLDETYHRILNNIPRIYHERTMTILRFLTWSERPLRPEELVDAVAVQPDNQPSFEPNNRMPEPEDIMKICSSLSEIPARARIASLCLAYFSDLDHNLLPSKVRARLPLAQYCARYWPGHAKAAGGVDEGLHARILEFLDEQKAYRTCYKLCDPEKAWDQEQASCPEGKRWARWTRRMQTPSPLYYTSLTGLTEIVEALLAKGAEVNELGRRYGNAVQVASAYGHVEIVRMLLERGAFLDVSSDCFCEALLAASDRGHAEIVQIPAARGANLKPLKRQSAARYRRKYQPWYIAGGCKTSFSETSHFMDPDLRP